MPTSQRFVPTPYGVWTQVCQQNDLRSGLIVGVLSGACVIGMQTTSPPQSTDLGVLPSGIFLSASQGTGPSYFSLSRPFDGDAVAQGWFIYVGTGSVANADSWSSGLLIGTPPSVPLTFLTAQGELVIVGIGCGTGNFPMTATSDVYGLLPVIYSGVVTDGATDQVRYDVWIVPTATVQTITFTAPDFSGTGTYQVWWSQCVGGAVDVTGSSAVVGASVTVVTPGIPVTNPECVIGIFSGLGNVTDNGATGSVTNAAISDVSITSPDASVFTVILLAGITPAPLSQVIVTMGMSGPLTTGNSRVFTLLPAIPAGPAPVVSVFETFELQQPTQPTMTVQLPQLSREGAKALHELITGEPLPSAAEASVDDPEGGG